MRHVLRPRSLKVERLERREMLCWDPMGVTIGTAHPDTSALAGETVPLYDFSQYTDVDAEVLSEVLFERLGTEIENQKFHLLKDGDKDGTYEERVATNLVLEGWEDRVGFFPASETVDSVGTNYRVVVEINPDTPPGTTIGLAGLLPYMTTNQDELVYFKKYGDLHSAIVTVEAQQEAQLHVEVQPLVASDTAVAGQKDINLLRTTATAVGENLLLTDMKFAAQQGSALNGWTFAFWVDAFGQDGIVDTRIQDGVIPQWEDTNGNDLIDPDEWYVTFDNLVGEGYVILEGQDAIFEVHMDVAPSFFSSTLQLQHATQFYGCIGVEELDSGMVLDEDQIFVTTVPSTLWRFATNLYVSQDARPTPSQQLLGGELADDPAMALRAYADGSGVVVTYIGAKVNGFSQSINTIELRREGETVPFATMTRGDVEFGDEFGVHLTGNEFVVQANEADTFFVFPEIKKDVDGGNSAEKFELLMGTGSVRARTADWYDLAINDQDFEAEGEVFIGWIDQPGPDQPMVSDPHTVVMSKTEKWLPANPDPDGTAVPTGIYPVGQFYVDAMMNANVEDGINDQIIRGVGITTTLENVEVDAGSIYLYNKHDATTRIQPTLITDTSDWPLSGQYLTQSFVAWFMDVDLGINSEIGPGERLPLVFELDIRNSQIVPAESRLQVSIEKFSEPRAVGFGPGNSRILVTDRDGDTDEDFFWLDLDNIGASTDAKIECTDYRS